MSDHPNRLRWWLACDRRARFEFWRPGERRCNHVNRLGIRCFRVWWYDGWCGLHNYMCGHHDGNRHVRRVAA